MKRTFVKPALAALASIGLAIPLVLPIAPATASSYPTGQVAFGQSTIEPAYNDTNGNLMYLLTPNKAPMKAPTVTWAPLYVIVYPTSTTVTTPLNCMHVPADNCPDHGPAVAGAAMGIMPGVYGQGVLGHDHIGDAPSGSDFNFQWLPVLVLFTNSAAANEHVTTESQLDALIANGDVTEIPIAPLTFNCSTVSAATYNLGTPVTPV